MLLHRPFRTYISAKKKERLVYLLARNISNSNKFSGLRQVEAETLTGWQSAKPLSEIPSPPKQMFFGHANLLTKNWTTAHKLYEELRQKYGNIVLLRVPGRNMILIFDPDDSRALYGNDGRTPHMAGFEPLEFYR